MIRLRWILIGAFLASTSCQPEGSGLIESGEPGTLALSITGSALSTVPPTTWQARITGNGVDLTRSGNPGQSVSLTLNPGTYAVSMAGLAQGGVVLFGERDGLVVTAGGETQVTVAVESFVPATINAPAAAPTGQSITVSWAPVAGASSGYEVESSPSASFTQGVDRTTTTQTSVTMTPSQPGTYYFRVRAQPTGRVSAAGYWSEATTGTVVQPEAPPRIELNAASLTFIADEGGGDPAAQEVTVTNAGGGTLSDLACGEVSYSAGQPSGWLGCTLSRTLAPAALTLVTTTGSLPSGQYTATVAVTSGVAANSPQHVSISLVVNPIQAPPFLELSRTSVRFNAEVGGASPSSETITISNGGGGTLGGIDIHVSYGPGQNAGWLNVGLSGATAPATLTLTPTSGSLPANTYNATVSISSDQAANSPQTVSVTMVVGSAPPRIQLSTSSVTLAAPDGPSNVGVEITNGGGGILSGLTSEITYTPGEPTGWLAYALPPGSAPTTIAIFQSSPQFLPPPGTYSATVSVASPTASNSPQDISVTLIVSSSHPFIQLSATSVNLVYPEGPGNVGVDISNGGGGILSGLSSEISYAPGQPTGWLAASLPPMAAPTTISIFQSSSQFLPPPGTYSATVSVTSPVAINSPQVISVTLTVRQTPSAPGLPDPEPTSSASRHLEWAHWVGDCGPPTFRHGEPPED